MPSLERKHSNDGREDHGTVLVNSPSVAEELNRAPAHAPGGGRALREIEERFRLLVEQVEDYAIFMLDPTGIVTSWNIGAERIKGYRADEVIGRHYSLFFLPEDVANGRPERQLRTARERGRAEDEGWRRRKDGTRFWANAVVTALWGEQRELRGFAKVTRDLTERRIREQVERQALLHEEASRLKDEFLAILSHELRTPLNVIVGEVWRLRNAHLTPEQAARAWNALERNVRLQTRIIDDLLDVSRIASGKVKLELQPVDVAALASQVVEEMRRLGEGVSIELARNGGDATINGDPTRLHQILTNVLSNAVKFTPSGGRIDVTILRNGDRMRLEVRDTGIGIRPEFLPYVFDRFSQGDASSRRSFSGLGLGMSIVKQLVELHGGAIEVMSEGEGRGTTVTITFPTA